MEEIVKHIVVNKDQLNRVVEELRAASHVVFDLETTGLSFLTDEIVGFGVGTMKEDLSDIQKAYYIPVVHHHNMEQIPGLSDLFDGPTHLPMEYVVEQLKPIFLDFDKILIAHNLKFDMQMLLNVGIDLREKLALPKWFVPDIPKEITEGLDLTSDSGRAELKGRFRSWLKEYIDGLPKEASCADTMVMSWLLDENRKKYGLKKVATEDLGIDMTKLDEIIGKKKFHEADATKTLPYAVLDVVATGKLFAKYLPKLKEEKQDQVFWKIEMPFVGVLQAIERRGMPINRTVLEIMGERCEKRMAELQQEIFRLAGKVFNVGSSPQLAQVIHDELGMPVIARTPKGAVKTDEETLKSLINLAEQNKDQLKERHYRAMDIIKKVLEYRSLQKTYGTYVKGLIECIDVDGRIHTSFHQTGTVTGRLSSSEPNLQNLPADAIFKDKMTIEEYEDMMNRIRESVGDDEVLVKIVEQKQNTFTIAAAYKKDEEGNDTKEISHYEVQWKIRDAFQEYIRDWWLVVGDLSQMELRMTAHLSKDENMIQGFKAGHDIHAYNASIVNNKPIEAVTKKERKDAKAVSFGIVYGKSAYGFCKDWYGKKEDFWVERPSNHNPFGEINPTYVRETQKVIDQFFKSFPAVAQAIAQTHKFVERHGFVRLITGRKRRIPEIFSMENKVKNRARRQSFNARVQGSSADYLKMAMIKLERELYVFQDPSSEYQQGQICQVHDELITTTKPENAREIRDMVKYYMENVVKLSCPIVAEVEIGYKYGSCK